jgi:hypothetical protein
MPSLKLTLPMAALLLFAAAAQAAEGTSDVPAKGGEKGGSRSGWTYQNAIGVEANYQEYNEPGMMKETAGFVGVTYDGQLTIRKWQIRPEVRFSFGQMDYSSYRTGTVSGIDDYEFEGRMLFGYSFHSLSPLLNKHGVVLTPYIGYGYRRLQDNFGGKTTSTGAKGYDRISQYNYVPIGIEAFYKEIIGDISLKPTVEYDVFIGGNQESDLSQVHSALPNVNNSQERGYGIRASLLATAEVQSAIIEFGPFIRYWSIADSKPVTGTVVVNGITYNGTALEPANNTIETGLAFKVRF